MKAKVINLQFTVNTGNYENTRIGGEWGVENGDDLNECFKTARKELLAAYKAMKEDSKTNTDAAAMASESIRSILTSKNK